MPERIGELVVTGDKDTVFGELAGEFEALESTLPLARLAARVRRAADHLQLERRAAGAGSSAATPTCCISCCAERSFSYRLSAVS